MICCKFTVNLYEFSFLWAYRRALLAFFLVTHEIFQEPITLATFASNLLLVGASCSSDRHAHRQEGAFRCLGRSDLQIFVCKRTGMFCKITPTWCGTLHLQAVNLPVLFCKITPTWPGTLVLQVVNLPDSQHYR
jgi:hypothetical protein